MRFVTFLGLVMIAKSINPIRIGEAVGFILPVLVISFVVDVFEIYLKWNNLNKKS